MSTVIAWLLTYVVHSTVLLGGAWRLRVAFRERRLGLQEAVLRAALVGGFVTASLQLGLGLKPIGGVYTVPTEAVVEGPVQAVLLVSEFAPAGTGPLTIAPEGSGRGVPFTLPAPEVWQPVLVVLWGAIALAAVWRLVVASRRLQRMLYPRHPVRATGLLSKTAALAANLGLRRAVPVSTAPRLEVPLATGLIRPEVCLPTRALDDLREDQQEALCAHELAHVARRDPAWILVARLVEAIAPMQPLNTWARRRLQDIAECLTDDLAVAASGQPEGLARSLVDVASWTVADAVPFPAAAAGALSARSRLGHRVERLMDPLRTLERPRRALLPLAAAAVLTTALVTPVVSGSVLPEAESGLAPSAPLPPDAPEAPAPPQAPEPPEAPAAPEPPKAPSSDAERELEALTRRIEERAQKHSAEMERLGAEIERIVEAGMPPPEEMERLGREIESAAETLAEARLAERDGREAPSEEELAEARARLEAAKAAMKTATRDLQIPEGELRRLQEKAREMAEAASPTAEERRRLKELSRELVEESMPDLEELKREMKEISGSISRETMEQIREGMRSMREAMREARPQMREAARMAREAARTARAHEREAQRQAQRTAREAREFERQRSQGAEASRSLDEAEASHLEGSVGQPPESE